MHMTEKQETEFRQYACQVGTQLQLDERHNDLYNKYNDMRKKCFFLTYRDYYAVAHGRELGNVKSSPKKGSNLLPRRSKPVKQPPLQVTMEAAEETFRSQSWLVIGQCLDMEEERHKRWERSGRKGERPVSQMRDLLRRIAVSQDDLYCYDAEAREH